MAFCIIVYSYDRTIVYMYTVYSIVDTVIRDTLASFTVDGGSSC